MKLSIVTTMYYSAPYLPEFYERITAAAQQLTNEYELIFVNDGSPDNALELVLTYYQKDSIVKVVDLSRNFGHHKAMMTGLSHANGDLVFLLDCDLEEDPELLQQFYSEMVDTGADVIYGVQAKRSGRYFDRLAGDMFYRVFNNLADISVPRNIVTARLMTQKYVTSLVAHQEREVFLLGLWTITGFDQRSLLINKHTKGTTTYNMRRKAAVLVNSVTSFSSKPLVIVFYMGAIILAISLVAAFYLIVQRIFFGVFLAGWPSLIVSVWLLGGLIIFCLGIIGIYLSKIFAETKQRPYTIVRRFYDHEVE